MVILIIWFLLILQKLSSQKAIDLHIMESAEARDDLAQGTFVFETGLFIGTPAADIVFHILRLNTVQIEFHKTVAHHQFCRLSPITAPMSRAIDNDIKLGALVKNINIFQPDQTDQAIIFFQYNSKNNMAKIFIEVLQALLTTRVAGGIDGEIAPNLFIIEPCGV